MFGWLIIAGAFAFACLVSAVMAHRWGRGSHTGMSEGMEVEAHRPRLPKTWI